MAVLHGEVDGVGDVGVVLIVVVVVSGVGSMRHLTSDSSSLTNVSKGNILQINTGVHIFLSFRFY